MSPFVFSSQRLWFRPFVPEDAPLIHRLNQDPEVMRYVHEEPFRNEKHALDFLIAYRYSTDGLGRWALIEQTTGNWMGWCGLKRHSNGEVDLGFRLLRQYWGNGFATEAAQASLDYGFREKSLPRIIGRVMPSNIASRRVLEKVGMDLVGRANVEDLPEALLYEIHHPAKANK
ncbi:MAG: GNAT family N-acetyltransferase [Bacteroidota bacterium]|nr:GNAT family N-acetyltransferase [Bacteroidota bacterium]